MNAAATPAPDPAAAELVTHTRRAVAAATPVVDDAPAAAGRRDAVSSTVVRLGRGSRRPGSPPRGRTWLLVAAAVLVVAVPLALWARSDRRAGPVTTPRATRGAPRLVPRWLPDDLTVRGQPQRSGGGGVVHGRTLQRTGDPAAEVVAVTITAPSGRRIGWSAADDVRRNLAEVLPDAGSGVTVARGGRGFVVVARGSATIGDARDAVSLLDNGGGATDGGGWHVVGPVMLGWLPGVAPTTTTGFFSHFGDGWGVAVSAVTATLPDRADLAPVVGDVAPLRLPGADGWTWTPGDDTVAIWQEAPGVVGVVTATGLDPGELARLVRSVEPQGRGARP